MDSSSLRSPPAGPAERDQTAPLRSSAELENETEPLKLQTLLANLHFDPSMADINSHWVPWETLTNNCLELRSLLAGSTSNIQDQFRREKGLEALLSCLDGSCSLLERLKVDEVETYSGKGFFEFLKVLVDLLSDALLESPRNKYAFSRIRPSSGWNNLELSLKRVQHCFLQSEPYLVRLYGILFAFAMRDEDGSSIISDEKSFLNTDSEEIGTLLQQIAGNEQINEPVATQLAALVSSRAESKSSAATKIYNPETFSVIESLRAALFLENTSVTLLSLRASVSVLSAYLALSASSSGNSLKLNQCGLLSSLLQCLKNPNNAFNLHHAIRPICQTLLAFGVSNVEDAQTLFQIAGRDGLNLQLALQAALDSRKPDQFLFDMSSHGFASLEIAQLPSVFPPSSPAPGYTFTAWINVEKYDNNAHTTLLGVFDQSQTCFLLVYIERTSHQLVLQTSVTSSKPSVRFKSTTFHPNKWYHIVLVHRRPLSDGSSRAALYINGDLAEQVLCQYPKSPPVVESTYRSHPLGPLKAKSRAKVQAFIGTPRDLSPRLGESMLASQWSLANAYLFSDALSAELIFVFRSLGPSYQGNFQDCLGSFQTYRASAVLNLRNEKLNPGSEDSSLTSKAIRSKAGRLLSEDQIILGVSPRAVYDQHDMLHTSGDPSLARSNIAADTIRGQLPTGVTRCAFNLAGFTTSSRQLPFTSILVLTGGVRAYCPLRLDDMSWRINGCATIALCLIEATENGEALKQGLRLCFELVNDSWRNSEAFEQDQGFALLSWLLQSKISIESSHLNRFGKSERLNIKPMQLESSVIMELMLLTLEFVGLNHQDPSQSLIINPLAFRSLIIDNDIWQLSGPKVQALYFESILILSSQSRFRDFNIRRLGRMRLIKKFLELLKGQFIAIENITLMLKAFKVVLRRTGSADSYRSLALYLTSAVFSQNFQQGANVHRPTKDSSSRSGSILPDSLKPIPSYTLDSPPQIVANDEIQFGARTMSALAELLCDDTAQDGIKKFGKTVTNKWLLNVLLSSHKEVVEPAMLILARLLLVQGPQYVSKFEDKQKGFLVLQERLRSHFSSSCLWNTLFSIFLGIDIRTIEARQHLRREEWLKRLKGLSVLKDPCPAIFPVMIALLEEAILISKNGKSPKDADTFSDDQAGLQAIEKTEHNVDIPVTAITILIECEQLFPQLRSVISTSSFMRDMIKLLYAPLKPAPSTSISQQQNVSVPQSAVGTARPIVRQTTSPKSENSLGTSAQEHSSYIVINDANSKTSTSGSHDSTYGPRDALDDANYAKNQIQEHVETLLVRVCVDQLQDRKDFTGLGLFQKAPICPPRQMTLVNSSLFSEIIDTLVDELQTKPHLLREPRYLLNLSRFGVQAFEAFGEGWYLQGASFLLKYSATVLSLLRNGDEQVQKTGRLCTSAVQSLQNVCKQAFISHCAECFSESVMPQLEEIPERIVSLSDLFTTDIGEYEDRLFYPVYAISIMGLSRLQGRGLRLVGSFVLETSSSQALDTLSPFFDDRSFSLFQLHEALSRSSTEGASLLNTWATEHTVSLNGIARDLRQAFVQPYLFEEADIHRETLKSRIIRRDEKAEQLHLHQLTQSHALTEAQLSARHWVNNIREAEHWKYIRVRQDKQESLDFLRDRFADRRRKTVSQDQKPEDENQPVFWQLDESEGRDRMRTRLSPLAKANIKVYEPKRVKSVRKAAMSVSGRPDTRSPLGIVQDTYQDSATPSSNELGQLRLDEATDADGFEVVANPFAEDDFEDDKNRKVMRSLERGERVYHVYNVSRIVGLEAYEGLLIVGKDNLYLVDGLFQRSDGEVVNIRHAPLEERDKYTQIISGQEIEAKRNREPRLESTSHWPWADVLALSRRHFLTRAVAVEIFFADGRSYLLTTSERDERDALHNSVSNQIEKVHKSDENDPDERSWRSALLKSPVEPSSRFAQVFNPMTSNPYTKAWLKGEMSNFHYLMRINSMAGRTFNDLTQYPVFPWVLSDYSSEELDLTDVRSFRDLSRPMGCQDLARAQGFKERYDSFAEMMDENTPAFHYGTHYSSAMIVTSYLIRLQPFVHSHVLLHGGSFDYADRLFFSIERAWFSASKETFSDVRELIPEFFYLPEFLQNINKFDFGTRQESQNPVDDVILPPWAKGDPKIFIAKHREALESPYVSQNLHQWIDLVFGFKQRGEAAIEATNVFHYLSYQGAKDLDSITDTHERTATIGIIHNFGQTPRQIFFRPHERREDLVSPAHALPNRFKSLKKTSTPILDSKKSISMLYMSPKGLLASNQTSRLMPYTFDTVAEWGYPDRSLRFWTVSHRKMTGIHEQLHQNFISMAMFHGSKSLITASLDGTISVWTVICTNSGVELSPRITLFHHFSPVDVIAVSSVFSLLLSVDRTGSAVVWDLNRFEKLHTIEIGERVLHASISDLTGHLLLCTQHEVCLLTQNAQIILSQKVDDGSDDIVRCTAFHSFQKDIWPGNEIVFTGHTRCMKVWVVVNDQSGVWKLELIRSFGTSSSVTAILGVENKVFTGGEDGQAFEWTLPPT